MSIKLLTNSLLTTFQDLGRNKFRAFGINPGGAMDKTAVRLINILLGNDEGEGVLEIHFPAPKILFEKDALIAIGGADFAAKLDDKAIENWQTILVKKGQILSFPKKIQGNRLYLSVKGGFKIEDWLGSKSTNLKAKKGGFEGRKLEKNDVIPFSNSKFEAQRSKRLKISPHFAPNYSSSPKIRLIAGAEYRLLTGLSEEALLKKSFTITQNSDRMGFQLNGETLYLLHDKELVSSAINFGTIQLLPNGQLIILMADHQTTGGYPRIGNVISADLPLLAQLGTNDLVRFEIVTLAEAEILALDFERDLNFLRIGCQFSR